MKNDHHAGWAKPLLLILGILLFTISDISSSYAARIDTAALKVSTGNYDKGNLGRWILEGGRFTRADGSHPSNEYLRVNGQIFYFYTNGYAAAHKHEQYYTPDVLEKAEYLPDTDGTWEVCGWWYEYIDGTYPRDGFAYLPFDGSEGWYYFDVDGWMYTGWLDVDGHTYYLSTGKDLPTGRMFTGWHEIDGKWYYFSGAGETLGELLRDTVTPDGFTVDPTGARVR